MNALVVYDSYFGNTERIAQAIGNALSNGQPVTVKAADQVTTAQLQAVDLLIVGSPTRGFRPTEGVNQLLKRMSGIDLAGKRVAAFDTRIRLETIESRPMRFMVKTGGFAAATIAKQLKSKGGTLVAPPEGFTVDAEKGPLTDGELERAAAWAKQVAGA